MPVLNSKEEIKEAVNLLDNEINDLKENLKKYDKVFGENPEKEEILEDIKKLEAEKESRKIEEQEIGKIEELIKEINIKHEAILKNDKELKKLLEEELKKYDKIFGENPEKEELLSDIEKLKNEQTKLMEEKEQIKEQLNNFKTKGYNMKQIRDRVQQEVEGNKNINMNKEGKNEIISGKEKTEKIEKKERDNTENIKENKNPVVVREKNEIIPVKEKTEKIEKKERDTITLINFNAKEGKYECYRVDSDKNIIEQETAEPEDMSRLGIKKLRKGIKEVCQEIAKERGFEKNRYNKIVKMIDPNVLNLLYNDEQDDYVESLLMLKKENSIKNRIKRFFIDEKPDLSNNTFLGAVNYDMRGFKKMKSMKFFERRKLNRIAKKQNKINFATYQSDKKNKTLIAALLATGVAVGGSLIGKDSDERIPIEDKNPNPTSEQQVNNETQKQTIKETDKANTKEKEVKVGIGSTATLESGTYYHDSNKSEPKGEMENLENKNVKIKYVAVKNSDGTTKQYKESDNINISEIKKNNPSSEIYVAIGNVEQEGMTNYDNIGWMNYDDVESAFEKIEKEENINAINKETKTYDLRDGKSQLEIKDGKAKVIIDSQQFSKIANKNKDNKEQNEKIEKLNEQIKKGIPQQQFIDITNQNKDNKEKTSKQNEARKKLQEQLRKGVNGVPTISDFMNQKNQQQEQEKNDVGMEPSDD